MKNLVGGKYFFVYISDDLFLLDKEFQITGHVDVNPLILMKNICSNTRFDCMTGGERMFFLHENWFMQV